MKKTGSLSRAICLGALGVWAASAAAAPVGAALERPAVQTALAARSVLQGAARAGQRIVAVGERGIVLLSDDEGSSWRQAAAPVSVGLTAVRFVGAQHGWIVGHGGTVLATRDGGTTWTKQLDGLRIARLMLDEAKASGDAKALAEAERLLADGADKPLLDLHFFDERNGIVIGAFNTALVTSDGGATWRPIDKRLDNPRLLHLYALRARGNEVLIVGEQGLVLRSTDRGGSFQRLALPYKGSFFTAEFAGPSEIVIAGLRGNAWKSVDGGASWAQLAVPAPVSFTTSAVDADGRVWLGNQAGIAFALQPDGALAPQPNRLPPLNGLLPLGGGQMLALAYIGAVRFALGGEAQK